MFEFNGQFEANKKERNPKAVHSSWHFLRPQADVCRVMPALTAQPLRSPGEGKPKEAPVLSTVSCPNQRCIVRKVLAAISLKSSENIPATAQTPTASAKWQPGEVHDGSWTQAQWRSRPCSCWLSGVTSHSTYCTAATCFLSDFPGS